MAIHHARVCGACERECPSWANRCPACGSTAISYQMIIAPPSGTRASPRDQPTPHRASRRSAGAWRLGTLRSWTVPVYSRA